VGETKERLLHIKGCKSDARGNLRTPDGKELRGPEGNKISLSNYQDSDTIEVATAHTASIKTTSTEEKKELATPENLNITFINEDS